jgi:hypothetical protein
MDYVEYVEISGDQSYGGCCRVSELKSTNPDPERIIDVFPKAVCEKCGRRWCTWIGGKWRYIPKMKKRGYPEDEETLEVIDE